MILLQLVLYCLLFTGIVKLAVLENPVNGLFFYPKQVQEKAIELSLGTRKTIDSRFKRFMSMFYIVMAVALVLLIGLWNHITNFKEAYLQAVLFLEVMNWYDGLIIGKLWVGHSNFWLIQGLEDIPYVQTWPQMLKKRLLPTLIWAVGAVLIAGIVVLFF